MPGAAAALRDEVGLVYLNNRYHDPTLGTFISVDPLVQMTGEPYIYASGNPATLSDPTGLCAWSYIEELGCYGSPGGNTIGANLAARASVDSELDSAGPLDLIGQALAAADRPFQAAADTIVNVANIEAKGGDIWNFWDWRIATRESTGPADPYAEGSETREWIDVSTRMVVDGFAMMYGAAMGAQGGLGNPCRANSFVPGTLVLMADGSTMPIEEIEVGDVVWAADPVTGEAGPRRVVDVIVGEGSKQLVDIRVDGATVTATAKHPFWVDDAGRWVDADDLQAGDVLVGVDGDVVEVDAVHERSAVRRVHNLTVEGVHTYFVVAGDDPVLVHNCQMTPNQQALKELVDEVTIGGRRPLAVGDAESVLDWADEYNYPGWRAKAGDVSSPSNWTGAQGTPHIHLPGAGRGGHVPVQPGVPPRYR